MLSNAFIEQPHQLDPRGQNLDYLTPQYKFFSTDTNIAQKQSQKKHDFKTDLDKVKFDFYFKKAMTQDIYPTKIDYHFSPTNRDEFVGGAQKDENIHARQMRLLRLQAENFEKGEDNKLKNLSDTVPFTEDRGTFLQILQNLAEIRSNVGTGESLKEVKPERLNDILSKTMNSGINFNKKQLNQLRQVIESILDNSIINRVIQNKPKFLTMFKLYAIVVHLLATVNTQDNEIRKRKLDAFVDNVLDQSAKFIAENLTDNYRSIVDLKLADIVEKAKAVDKVPGKNEKDKASKKGKEKEKDKTQAERKEELKGTDLDAWQRESTKTISNLLNRDDIVEIATDLGLENIRNKTKPKLISEIKQNFKKENIELEQTREGKKARKEKQEELEASLSEGNVWKGAFTDDIHLLNRDQLINVANSLGIDNASDDSKDTIIKKIEDDIRKKQREEERRIKNSKSKLPTVSEEEEEEDDDDEIPPLETPEEEAKRTGSGKKRKGGKGKQKRKRIAGFIPDTRSLLRLLK